jgi:DNA-binding MarR family transcriptional regulator
MTMCCADWLRATQLSVPCGIADGAMSIAALANFLGMDRLTLTRNLRPLEKEGLVSSAPKGGGEVAR